MSDPAKKVIAQNESTTSEMIRTRTFAGLWLTYVFGTAGGFIAISLAAKYGCDICGLPPAVAVTSTAVFALFNGMGRPVFGYLCDRFAGSDDRDACFRDDFCRRGDSDRSD